MSPTKKLNEILNSLPPDLLDKNIKDQFKKYTRSLEDELIDAEFKLKRTLRDKQIATTILERRIKELEGQKSLIEEQSRFKEEMFANVSHELRTPLHGILGMSHLLGNTQMDNHQKEYVDVVKSSADNLLVIINDILSLSQINAGKIKLQNEIFSLDTLFRDLESIVEIKATNKSLNLIFMTPPNLPSYLMGDRTRLYQILLNLLNNAIKFTQKGFVALTVFILEQEGGHINLSFEIKDSGIGIKKEKLQSVFESFSQVHDSHGQVEEGVGLGLNIVKKLLELMNGSIEVNSKEGKGTTFSVDLKFEQPDNQSIEEFENSQSELVVPDDWQNRKFLMIEDNPANVIYAKSMFSDWNIKIEVAENLEEATTMVALKKYDCILSDVKLPDGNGLDFIAALRKDQNAENQNTPVLVLTASANEKELNYSKEIDVQSYIGKPFPPEILVSELKKVLVNSSEIVATKNVTNAIQDSIESKNIESQIATTPPIQEEYFSKLDINFKGNNKLKIELINAFLEQIPPVLEKMESNLKEEGLATFGFEAHRIKSTIKIIGLPQLEQYITKLDNYCYHKINQEQIPTLFEQFKNQAVIDLDKMNFEKNRLSLLN